MRVGTRAVVDTSGIRALVSEAQTRSITLKAVRAGIKVLLPRAKAAAPIGETGALKQSQGTKAVRGRRGRTGSFAVQGAKAKFQKKAKGRLAKPGKYDHLVQGGTRPHRIRMWKHLSTSLHPGAKRIPYRKQAFEGLKGQIGGVVANVMAVEVQKVIAKNSAKVLAKLGGRR